MDADGSHDPQSVGELLAALTDVHLAVGSRYIEGGGINGWDKRRLALSRAGNIYVRFVTGFPIRDATAGFVAFRRESLDKLSLQNISSHGYSYQIEFKNALLETGARFTEVPITFSERRLGVSKVSGRIVAEGLLAPIYILMRRLQKGKILTVLAVLFLACVAFFSFYKLTESQSVWYDEGVYVQLSKHISRGETDGFIVSPGIIERVPEITVGYPLLYPLAVAMRLFGDNIVVARVFMAISIIILSALSYLLARKVFPRNLALLSLALVAMFPPLYGNGKSVLGEVPGLVYLIASLLFLELAYRRNSKTAWLVLAGIGAGLCAVTKPIFIVFLPALAITALIAYKRRNFSKKKYCDAFPGCACADSCLGTNPVSR